MTKTQNRGRVSGPGLDVNWILPAETELTVFMRRLDKAGE